MATLEVQGLHVRVGDVHILRGVDFSVDRGKTLGVVGESGCGKSMTGLALMGMLPRGAVVEGSVRLDGRELLSLKRKEWLDIRGQEVSMVMQDPFTSLNPVMQVGWQIAEVFTLHQGLSRAAAWEKAVEMLRKVGVPAPEESAHKYPHQMSGGQRQRVVIAIAFASTPKVLVADEPTTALDVTLQAQILRLLKQMQEETGTAVVLISHDIGVIGSLADDIAVFYAGRVVESGPAEDVLRRAQHPYTQALLRSVPQVGMDRLHVIDGQPPILANLPPGCAFAPRCPHRFEKCGEDPMPIMSGRQKAECWLLAEPARQAPNIDA